MKVAVITGAGGYIGSCVARRLAENCKVVLCDISLGNAKKIAEEINEKGGCAEACQIDVTDSKNVNDVFSGIKEKYGQLDIAVHVAGGSARIAGPEAKYTGLINQEDYVIDAVLKINLYGAIYVSRAAGKIMAEQGTGGRIVNFSSVVGINGLTDCTEYAAAKGGVIALVKSLAKELGQYHITVNSVAPGIVMRPEETGEHRAYETNYLHEKCTGDDVASVVNFLCSDEAHFVTGQTYVVDGGRGLSMKGTD